LKASSPQNTGDEAFLPQIRAKKFLQSPMVSGIIAMLVDSKLVEWAPPTLFVEQK
jgi:hypothetical protein